MFVYKTDITPDTDDIIRLFGASGIKRPVHDRARIAAMFANANIVVSAWHGNTLVGIARALTDFSYCCYLSDLAVDREFQKSGIGKNLMDLVRGKIDERVSLILLSAPDAMGYYPKLGFEKIENGFIIKRQK